MTRMRKLEKLITGNDRNICAVDVYLPENRHVQHAISQLYSMKLSDDKIDKLMEDQ